MGGCSGRNDGDLFPAGWSGQSCIQGLETNGFLVYDLTQSRRDATPEIKQKTAVLTQGVATPYEKMAALAKFVQQDIRYIAIELGIGGVQPHPAAYIFNIALETARTKRR